ncbi:MAG TPA: DUF348 domain-containing protein [Candidatus Moranbacteria bacterium]|nr:DUF348 domain-containing protein [Candidatus Moranbacteria bacterium]
MLGKTKKLFGLLSLLAIIGLIVKFSFFSPKEIASANFQSAPKNIFLSDNGLDFQITTHAKNVAEILKEKNILLSRHDEIIPDKDTPLYSGINIKIERAFPIKILVDGKTINNYTREKTVGKALEENHITLSPLDKTSPNLNALIEKNLTIIITRIKVKNVTQKEKINFKTIIKTDSKLDWSKKKIKQPGVKGLKEIIYHLVYKNGKKISQTVLVSKIIQKPIPQIEVHGSHLELGKAKRGQGSWYSQPLNLKEKYNSLVDNFAASTTLPKGSYAKVTNLENGKSLIVQINDSGPYVKKRIIDLDKKAFAKIAPIGAGVIAVKVAPILN